MKPMKSFSLGSVTAIFVLALVLSGFWAGKAYAATGCFNDTNGHWAETFICWMKENNITSGIGGGNYGPEQNVTRAQMAVFMQKQADVPPSTGDILVSSGFSNWGKFYSSDPISYSNYAQGTYVSSSIASTYTMMLQPDLPVVLYGRSLQLVGAEICYQAATGNFLSEVRLRTYTHATTLSGSNVSYKDATDRADTACRYYVISPAPVVMTAEMGAEIFVDLTWTTANTEFGFGRTTFVFQPTTTTAASASLLNIHDKITTLQVVDSTMDNSPESGR